MINITMDIWDAIIEQNNLAVCNIQYWWDRWTPDKIYIILNGKKQKTFPLQTFIPGTQNSVEKIFSVNNTYHNGG